MVACQVRESGIFNGEDVEIPARPYRVSQLFRALSDKEEYREELRARMERFERWYPRLIRGALALGLSVPVALAVVFSLTPAEKVQLLTAWLVWLVVVFVFLVVVESLRALDAALLFYESPNRLVAALTSLAETLPHREIAVCRELTKLHEEVVRGPLPEVRDAFAAREREGAGIKGEIVLVIDGPSEAEDAAAEQDAEVAARARAAELKAAGVRSKDVARAIAEEFGIARNAAYDISLEA